MPQGDVVMRKLLSVIAVVGTSLALFHCASGSGSSKASLDSDAGDDSGDESPRDAGKKASSTTDAAPPPPPPTDAGVDAADAHVPVPDAAKPPPPPPPSAACSALASCCPALTSSTDQGACWVAIDYTAGHSMLNSVECGASFALFDCATAVAKLDLGPNCSQLAACCNSQEYGPYIGNDPACSDWQSENEDLCDSDLQSYYNDEYGDCL
jgi:hypothetical protein